MLLETKKKKNYHSYASIYDIYIKLVYPRSTVLSTVQLQVHVWIARKLYVT